MPGNLSENNLYTIGLIGTVIVAVLIVVLIYGSYKHWKTPDYKKGLNDPKAYYFLGITALISFILTRNFRMIILGVIGLLAIYFSAKKLRK